MEKINFKNLPDETTPINATNLNKMQENIEAEIQPLKENILSNNLFDGKLLTDKAHSSSGGIITSAGLTTCENYIKVSAGEILTLSNNGIKQGGSFLWYDKNLVFISAQHGVSTVEAPDGACYVAFNISSNDIAETNKLMLNYGTEPMEYEKYVNAIADLEKNKANIVNITTGTEFKTGRIIDGKEEYAKVINIGPLPNNTSKTVAHGLTYSNVHIHKIEGSADDGSGYITIPLPYVSATASELIKLDQVGANIRVVTSSDRTAYVNATATIYYTKNS